jgi:hypothetical protein
MIHHIMPQPLGLRTGFFTNDFDANRVPGRGRWRVPKG